MSDIFSQPSSSSQLETTQTINQSIIHILERITDGFIALDNQWRLIYANQHSLPWLGVDLVEMQGKNIWDLFPHEIGSITYQHYH
ncbi:MAG: PAS domain-containing protein, partial [Ktedonobacteraceae bacterium]